MLDPNRRFPFAEQLLFRGKRTGAKLALVADVSDGALTWFKAFTGISCERDLGAFRECHR